MLADPMLQLFGYAHLPAEKQTAQMWKEDA